MKLIESDCIKALRQMEDNSIDSIVTDPPYELGFMGKSWDATGIAFDIDVWAECLRVLKPGGHLLAFSGSRTYHRMAVAIEDAGFEIRDQIMWIYGSGFPKSKNIALSIDKGEGLSNRGRAIPTASLYQASDTEEKNKLTSNKVPPYEARTESAKSWVGWGTALKPAHEPIVLARKPLIGTVASNVLTYGTGGLNIHGARVGNENVEKGNAGRGTAHNNGTYKLGFGVSEKKQTSIGRWPANVIHDGSDEVVELFPDTKSGSIKPYIRDKSGLNVDLSSGTDAVEKSFDYGDSGSAARFFYCAKASKHDRNEGLEGFEAKQSVGGGGGVGDYLDDVNSASGKYGSEKAPQRNHHPTVKPTDLMRYLCRMVTPPNGIVLDPFMGSGSTGKAAVMEGFDFIGIDMNPEYVGIAKARIEFVQKKNDEFLL